MTSAMVKTEVETLHLQTIKSSHTLAATLAIHTLGNSSPGSMHTPDLAMLYHPTLAVAVFISHGN